jgi:hypothetical protein
MAMSDPDVDDVIDDVLVGPKRVQGDMGSIEQHSIPDLLALKKVRDAEAALGSGGPKLLMVRLVPPGSV